MPFKTTIRFLAIALAASLLAGMAMTARAEIIDRIVVIIDHRILITLSDIRKQRAIQTALGRDAGSDDEIVKDLIERHLFRQQIALFRELEIDEDSITRQMRGVRIPAGVSADDIRTTIREESLNKELAVQRFLPFIKVTDEEVRAFYENVALPAYRAAGQPIPPATEGMQAAREHLVEEKMIQEVGKWLEDLRRRATIEKTSN